MSTTTTQTLPTQTLSGASVHSGPVEATLNFYDPPADGSKPYNYVEPQPEGVAQRNFDAKAIKVSLQDMRGRESSFAVDQHAFLPLVAASTAGLRSTAAIDFGSDDSVKEHYYPEVERVLRSALPGKPERVFIFDHTVRHATPGADRGPVSRTHIDQTPESAAERVRVHMGDEADELLKGRVRLVNVWRPINGAVESFPLAVADSATVAEQDLVPVEHRYPHRTGYTAAVQHSPSMQWYYWSGMDDDERLLLQCFDNHSHTRVPHTAFEDPRSTPESKPRSSIEVRALIFG